MVVSLLVASSPTHASVGWSTIGVGSCLHHGIGVMTTSIFVGMLDENYMWADKNFQEWEVR